MTVKSSPISSGGRNRSATLVSGSLEKNLQAYVAAAGAGLIALAHPAAAEIIYTPSNIPITESFGGLVKTQFDINNDGTPDFVFSVVSYFTHGLGGAYLQISPGLAANQIVAIQLKSQRVTAAALDAGAQVGPSANFQSSPKGLFLGFFGLGSQSIIRSGSWLSVETAYLGLKFVVAEEVHYGWARVKFTQPGVFTHASIYGYAYESLPNQPIIAGKQSGSSQDDSQGSTENKATGGMLPAVANSQSIARVRTLGVLAAGAMAKVNIQNNPTDNH